MILERTHDMGLVASVMSHPSIWPHISDDGCTECAPVDHDSLHYMLVKDDELLGLFLVHPQNSVCYEMHTCLLPHAWGKKAAQAAQLLARWAFTELGCEKLVTNVPAYNRAALRFAKAGGMTQEGVNRASFMRQGVLMDQIFLGLTKKEWLCQQQQQS